MTGRIGVERVDGLAWNPHVGEAVTNDDHTNTYTVNTQTAVPGGTLPLTATLDMTGREVPQAEGTTALGYSGTYSCG